MNVVMDGEPYTWRHVRTVRRQATRNPSFKTTRRLKPSLQVTNSKLEYDMTLFENRINEYLKKQ